jgi:hypothetical protein
VAGGTTDDKQRSEFGDKYELMMVEEESSMDDEGGRTEPRVSFVMVPTVLTAPQPTTGWQLAVATVLALATALSAVQLGLVAEVSRLPPDFVAWFAQPENVEGYQVCVVSYHAVVLAQTQSTALVTRETRGLRSSV